MSSPPSAGDTPDARLTIGELFPHDDLVAQWVFSLTALAEDLQVGSKPAKEATDSGDLRALLFWQRHMVTRLFEARRLVTSARIIEAIREFLGDLLERPPGGANLIEAYTRPSADTPSMVEALYEQLRHLTVHYSKVGGSELGGTLKTYGHLPAEMTITTSPDGSPDLQFLWVQAIRSMEVLGDIRREDFLEAMRRSSHTTGSLTASWMMVSGIAILLHAHRLGIDANRLGDVSGWRVPPDVRGESGDA
jgi:hypothetical protein